MFPLLAALLFQTTPMAEPPVCAGIAPPPAGFEAWATVSGITLDPVPVGKTTGLMLKPSGDVKFELQPERAPAAGTFSGVYHLTVATAGTYRIALSGGAWIDLARDGKALKSVAHTEGPRCSGVRKIVDFDLAPGTYTLQLSGSKVVEMRVLIAPK